MLGCSHHAPKKKWIVPGTEKEPIEWTTLDINPRVHPDVVFDLNGIEKGDRLPFEDNAFDEIHAYSILEHYGKQGEYEGFFAGFRELWRVVKPGGHLVAGTPLYSDLWAWGDPGHTRIISRGTISYLCKSFYESITDAESPMTDYRHLVEPCWWEAPFSYEFPELGGYYFGLKKIHGVKV